MPKIIAASGPNCAIDLAQSNSWDVTLTANAVTLCIVNTPPKQHTELDVILRQDTTGGRVASWSTTSAGAVQVGPNTPQPVDKNGIIIRLVTHDGLTWFDVGSWPATSTFLTATLPAVLNAAAIGTVDPHVVGQLWNSSGTLTVSAG